jgi:hypothetical protein
MCFKGFLLCSVGAVVFRPVARQNIMAGNAWWSKAAHLMAARETGIEPRTLQRYVPNDLTSFS